MHNLPPAQQTIINKPWGQEIILTSPTSPYTGKILKINSNHRLSLQAHEEKEETLTLFSGKATLVIGSDPENLQETQMKPLHGYTIPTNTTHRLVCHENCLVFEASTPEKGTTKRIEDDYKRSDETQIEREKAHGQK